MPARPRSGPPYVGPIFDVELWANFLRRPDLEEVVWEVDRDEHGGEPIKVTLGEAIVFLNKVGITLDEARSERPPVEVEALLMSLLAQREAATRSRGQEERDNITVYENRVGEAAPGWVDDLPVEEG